MQVPAVSHRFAPLAVAFALAVALAGCTASNSLTQVRTQGYEIPDDALAQVRPGQSKALVQTVLGTPQTTNNFTGSSAWYYVETKLQTTSFGMNSIRERTVLAIYFDANDRVTEKVVYGLEDGVVLNMETRRTPSFGEDRTFVESVLSSVGL